MHRTCPCAKDAWYLDVIRDFWADSNAAGMALLDHKEDEAHANVFLKMWFSCNFRFDSLKTRTFFFWNFYIWLWQPGFEINKDSTHSCGLLMLRDPPKNLYKSESKSATWYIHSWVGCIPIWGTPNPEVDFPQTKTTIIYRHCNRATASSIQPQASKSSTTTVENRQWIGGDTPSNLQKLVSKPSQHASF